MDSLLENLEKLVYALPFFVLLVGSLLLAKWLYARTSTYQFDDELTERDNPAFGVHFALYLLGVMIAVGGTLYRGKYADLPGLALVTLFCVLCVGFMRLSIWVNAKFLLSQFSVQKEMVQDRNVGTGLVVGGTCVATGLILNGALSVEASGEGLGERVLSAVIGTVVFFVLGQLLLLAGAWVFRRIAGFDVHHTIEHDDNLAAGLAYAAFLIALGVIVRASLVDASPEILVEIATALIYFALGLLLLLTTRLLVDKVLLPSSPLSKEVAVDKNSAAGAVAAASFLCVALAFSWVITH